VEPQVVRCIYCDKGKRLKQIRRVCESTGIAAYNGCYVIVIVRCFIVYAVSASIRDTSMICPTTYGIGDSGRTSNLSPNSSSCVTDRYF
jgi:hypothetical protein